MILVFSMVVYNLKPDAMKRARTILSMNKEALSSSPLIFDLCTQMRRWPQKLIV